MATNFEYYRDEMLKIARIDTMPAMVGGKLTRCCDTDCDECDFDGRCRQKRIEWLYAEHIEQPKLTKRERAFCEAAQTGWIARDKNGSLFWYGTMPGPKGNAIWVCCDPRSYQMFNMGSLFKFIAWSDEKPWSIEDLLKLDVMEVQEDA